MLYRNLARPLLFRAAGGDAETIHEATLAALEALGRATPLARLARRLSGAEAPALRRQLFGLSFPGPLGLAAGMDKDGRAVAAWAALGFGFVELGTVTHQPQPGNERPRLFRLPGHGAIINRMGFNNAGAAALAARLRALAWRPFPIGVSLGKSKATPLEQAVADYCASLRLLHGVADYFAVNVSSPNTPGLRSLQDRAQLDELLAALQAENRALAEAGKTRPRPILVKIAPDLTDQAVAEALQVCADREVAGVIAVNTTLSRAGVESAHPATVAQAGGLSGAPLRERALAVVALIARETGGRLPIVGVGGVAGPDDARRMLEAGAALVQVYTGLVYEGPGLVSRINRALAAGARSPR